MPPCCTVSNASFKGPFLHTRPFSMTSAHLPRFISWDVIAHSAREASPFLLCRGLHFQTLKEQGHWLFSLSSEDFVWSFYVLMGDWDWPWMDSSESQSSECFTVKKKKNDKFISRWRAPLSFWVLTRHLVLRNEGVIHSHNYIQRVWFLRTLSYSTSTSPPWYILSPSIYSPTCLTAERFKAECKESLSIGTTVLGVCRGPNAA